MRTLPESANRQDWPRLVSQTVNENGRNIASLRFPAPRVITASATATADDRYILANATGGAIVVTLPAAADSLGAVITVKKTDTGANAVTIDPNASELIDGAANAVISASYTALTVYCDGTGWHIV